MATLDCTVESGTPVVGYEWTIDGSVVVISTQSEISVTDTGSYTCLAINSFGSDEATSIVTGGLIFLIFS